MDNREAVNWLINISADIGKAEHSDLWHYEQALTEIKDMLESAQLEERTEKRTETHACDCISRKDAIRWIKTECNPYGKPTLDFESGKRVMKHLEQMPPAQPELKWIPVSEKLPESGTYCLFTVFEHDSELEVTTIETVYGCFNDYGERRYWSWEDEVGKCCIEGEEQLDGYHDEIIEKVLAWMPLPEPYKGETT